LNHLLDTIRRSSGEDFLYDSKGDALYQLMLLGLGDLLGCLKESDVDLLAALFLLGGK
jgi:hypothetical protein